MQYQTWPLGSLGTSKKECRWENHPGFETHVESYAKSKNRGSDPTKWNLVQQKKVYKIYYSQLKVPLHIISLKWNIPVL